MEFEDTTIGMSPTQRRIVIPLVGFALLMGITYAVMTMIEDRQNVRRVHDERLLVFEADLKDMDEAAVLDAGIRALQGVEELELFSYLEDGYRERFASKLPFPLLEMNPYYVTLFPREMKIAYGPGPSPFGLIVVEDDDAWILSRFTGRKLEELHRLPKPEDTAHPSATFTR